MRSKGFDGMVCSIADVMGALGDRWGILIMRDVLLGLKRYDDIQRSTGATHATLSDRLKQLTENGLVDRQRYQTRPERFEYVPTRKGYDIGLLMQAMVQIGDRWKRAGAEAPPLRFIDARSGQGTKLAVVNAETGELIRSLQIVAEPGPGADEVMEWRLARGTETARRPPTAWQGGE